MHESMGSEQVVAAPGSSVQSSSPPVSPSPSSRPGVLSTSHAVANAVALVPTMADDASGSGASDCIPIQAGALKKGSHVVLKGFPCKIVDYSTSKTGKHGHAKANITGIDIFTQRKYEDISPTSHNMLQPLVNRNDFQLVDVDDEAYVTLMDSKNDTRSDLKLDLDGDDVHKKIKEEFDNGKDLVLTVLAAMKTEKIIAWKELQ